MVYSGDGIKKLIAAGKLIISPNPEIKESSIKIHFSEKMTLKPKEFRIAKSLETMKLSMDIAGLYDGYTHLSRRGIMTHLGSMFVDPGSEGQITFECFNASDSEVTIEAGERAGQLVILHIGE